MGILDKKIQTFRNFLEKLIVNRLRLFCSYQSSKNNIQNLSSKDILNQILKVILVENEEIVFRYYTISFFIM